MDHHYNTLAWMAKQWPEYKKEVPFSAKVGTRSGYAIAFEVGILQVLFTCLKGRRGGMSGGLIVVDTAQPIEVDKLLCSNLNLFRTDQPIQSFWTMTIQNPSFDFDEACPQFLIKKMTEWKANPELIRTMAIITGFGVCSVVTVSGGAPSLGKRT